MNAIFHADCMYICMYLNCDCMYICIHLNCLGHMYEWPLSNTDELFVAHISMGHVTSISAVRGWVMLHIWINHDTTMYAWVVSHSRIVCGTHMNGSCHKYIRSSWQGHVTPMHESWHNYAWMIRVTLTNWWPHTHEWVTTQVWVSHITHMIQSRHTHEWVMSHVWMGHVTSISAVRGWVMSYE